MYCSYWNNENQKNSIVQHLVVQKEQGKLSTIEIDNNNYVKFTAQLFHAQKLTVVD